ncbi:MAG: AEC family transporter [Gammaproteobacteria bacterium]|nr:AEC family transporter [Gammaproteobacteria bacterium]MCP4879812.1 AEC family transporter [Gammaproteobacteria bacterium]
MVIQLFEILAPVLICVCLGVFWVRMGESFDTPMVTKLVTVIGTPALVFYALSTANLDKTLFMQMGLSAILAYSLFLVAGYLLLPVFGLSRQAFLQTLTFPNIGNVGLPLCYLAFGEQGLALAIAFFVVFVMLQFTVGIALVSGGFSPRLLLTMPVIPATMIAMVFLLTETAVPKWALNSTKMIGDLTIPLMLFTLGVSLASLKLGNLRVSFGLASLRLILGFSVALLLVWLLGLRDEAAAVVILQCSMPVAVYVYLFAQLYEQRATEVAGVVIVSTLMSVVSLPLVLLYVL